MTNADGGLSVKRFDLGLVARKQVATALQYVDDVLLCSYCLRYAFVEKLCRRVYVVHVAFDHDDRGCESPQDHAACPFMIAIRIMRALMLMVTSPMLMASQRVIS